MKTQHQLANGTVSSILRVIAICVVLVASACRAVQMASDPVVVSVMFGQRSATVSAVVNQDLIVRLPSRSGTGYVWKMMGNPELVKLIEQSTVRASPSRPGGSEMQVFRFHVNAAGPETLRFTYQRPREKENPPARTFALRITAAQE